MDVIAAAGTSSSSTYRSKSRFTIVVDVRLSGDYWLKMSSEAKNVQLISITTASAMSTFVQFLIRYRLCKA